MAIYHYSVKIIGRKSGRSATGAAAYRAGEKIYDERTGLTHDYTRKQGVYHSQIFTPEKAPVWMNNRERLWNAVEHSEKRYDAQVAREIDVALPLELSHEQKQALVSGFVEQELVSRGMVADVSLHDLDSGNPHAHILLTTRALKADGFGNKNRDWNHKDFLQHQRQAWSEQANEALAQAGHSIQIDHRTLADQGIERVPQIHLGAQVCEMEQRGIETERGEQWREIQVTNQQLEALQRERQRVMLVESALKPEVPLTLERAAAFSPQEWRSLSSAQRMDLLTQAQFQQRQAPEKPDAPPDPVLHQRCRDRLAALKQQEQVAQDELQALERRGKRSLFNPFGVGQRWLNEAREGLDRIQQQRRKVEPVMRQLDFQAAQARLGQMAYKRWVNLPKTKAAQKVLAFSPVTEQAPLADLTPRNERAAEDLARQVQAQRAEAISPTLRALWRGRKSEAVLTGQRYQIVQQGKVLHLSRVAPGQQLVIAQVPLQPGQPPTGHGLTAEDIAWFERVQQQLKTLEQQSEQKTHQRSKEGGFER